MLQHTGLRAGASHSTRLANADAVTLLFGHSNLPFSLE